MFSPSFTCTIIIFVSFNLNSYTLFICGTVPQSECKVTDYLPISQIFRNISAFCPAYSALSCAAGCYARRFACINVKRQRALLAEFLLPFVVTSLLATRCSLLCPEGRSRLLSVVLVRYCQLLAAMCAARSQYATTILCSHTFTETMLVHAATIVRLKCSFHCLIFIYLLLFTLLGCKITHNFLNDKDLSLF